MRYELATLSIRLGTAAKVVEGIDAWVKMPEAKGTLLGCWMSEIGALNDVVVLRGFADQPEMERERRRLEASTNPFGCGEALRGLSTEGYAPFPSLPPVETGTFGPVYELRTYRLKAGGVPPTLAAWEVALPERTKISPLVIAMVALDGPARFTHIWPFASLDARSAARADAVKQGVWPPKGGPEWLTGEMTSTIMLPTAISPLK